jgi:hypothetical protein
MRGTLPRALESWAKIRNARGIGGGLNIFESYISSVLTKEQGLITFYVE